MAKCSYGLLRPKSGCPGGRKNGWREGWRYQDVHDTKNSSEWSRVSNGSHMLGVIIIYFSDRDVNRTFCMKQNSGIQARFWPKGKVFLYMQNDFFLIKIIFYVAVYVFLNDFPSKMYFCFDRFILYLQEWSLSKRYGTRLGEMG
jgi:hypothetical protein